ncbi:MAG: relaxase/mobilization nuclease domain-containing protein [Aureispira sp.]
MIIKTFSRTSPNMQNIVHYIADKDKAHEQPLQIYRNLPSAEIENITQAFEENLSFQTPQNKLTAYHDILSFHPLDVPQLSHDIIHDLVQQYITLRAPKSLWFGQLHTDQEHPHVHLLLSGNEYHSRKASRMGRPAFYQLRVDLEQYQQEHFPQLTHSLIYTRMKTFGQERNQQLQHQLTTLLYPLYEQALTQNAFFTALQNIPQLLLQPPEKVIWKGQPFQLKDLGIDLHLFQQLEQLHRLPHFSPPDQSRSIER